MVQPPFCRSVKTKIARKFIDLVKTCFDENHPLRKIFNSNTINISYSCMPNMGRIISMHNNKILNGKRKEDTKSCNCKKYECPLKNEKSSCRTKGVVYEATIETDAEKRHYVGLTANEFKERWYRHEHDFRKREKCESTELSKYVWQLKNNNIAYNIKWKILKKVAELKNGSRMCRLCTMEAAIIMKNRAGQLNKRTEIMNKCRHRNKYLLKNWKAEKRKA